MSIEIHLMSIETHLRIVGGLLIALGLAHAGFAKRFAWKEELARLSLLNRRIFQVHAFFIALVLVLSGFVTMFYAPLLLRPDPLSRVVLAGATIFWLCRLIAQFAIYDSSLWRGNRFNTVAHVLFSVFWMYTFGTYAVAARHVWR